MDDGSTWELDDGLRVPKYISVGCNFTHIGRYKLRADGKHFDLPHIQGMRPGKDNLYPDRGGQFESLFGELGGSKQGEPLQVVRFHKKLELKIQITIGTMTLTDQKDMIKTEN